MAGLTWATVPSASTRAMASRLCSMAARDRCSPRSMGMLLALLLVADRVEAPQSEPAVPSRSRTRTRGRVGGAGGELQGTGELVGRREDGPASLVEGPVDGIDRDPGPPGRRVGGQAPLVGGLAEARLMG